MSVETAITYQPSTPVVASDTFIHVTASTTYALASFVSPCACSFHTDCLSILLMCCFLFAPNQQESLHFEVVGGAHKDLFYIEQNGELKATQDLCGGLYEVSIRASNSALDSATATFVVQTSELLNDR